MKSRKLYGHEGWGQPELMTQVLHDVLKAFGEGGETKPPQDRIVSALQMFQHSPESISLQQLKHVCYGVDLPVGKDLWVLLDDAPRFEQLVDKLNQPRLKGRSLARCTRGLLHCFLVMNAGQRARRGPGQLRRLTEVLSQQTAVLTAHFELRNVQPRWLAALAQHSNLLGSAPCAPYGKEMAQGRTARLRELADTLGLPAGSWVWTETLMSYLDALTAGNDNQFRENLPQALDLLEGKAELKLPDSVLPSAAAKIVNRYQNCRERPEHERLRDVAVRAIGNPWLERAAWDAHGVTVKAREMVLGWFRRRLMRDFFELLAVDATVDQRRANYWLQWEPYITDMWFVLGPEARGNGSKAFKDLRERMQGKDRYLSDVNPQNNAFIMKIGDFLLIEFGVTGNACYVVRESQFQTDLSYRQLDISQLKQRTNSVRLAHASAWEERFDRELRDLGLRRHSSDAEPPLKFAMSNLQDNAQRSGFTITDNRPKGGALWLEGDNTLANREFTAWLMRNGFQFKPGRGYWMED